MSVSESGEAPAPCALAAALSLERPTAAAARQRPVGYGPNPLLRSSLDRVNSAHNNNKDTYVSATCPGKTREIIDIGCGGGRLLPGMAGGLWWGRRGRLLE